MQYIPFNGSGPALNALMAGTVKVGVLPGTSAIGPAQAGRIRVLAVNGARRTPQLADVPTYAEAGLADDVPVWNGLFAPAGTPRATLDELHAALVRGFASAAVRERAALNGDVLVVSTPDEFRATIARDIARVAALVKRIGYSPR
jgi:tripartite-type tricarboxylate transporter receptor subunit TctC